MIQHFLTLFSTAWRGPSAPGPGNWLKLPALACAISACLPASAQTPASGAWVSPLVAGLAELDAASPVRIGVFVQELGSGTSASYQARQSWYIASMVKLPVAIAVLRGIERGQFSLSTKVSLRASDYVDGAGPTNSRPVGALISVQWLLEQMMIHSDNTATDMLIGLVGAAEVNAVLKALVPEGFGRITTLGEVRRHIYSELVPQAHQLTGQDFILLNRERVDAQRLNLLARLTGTPVSRLRRAGDAGLEAAYKAYYATGLNSARLDAYADLLAQLADGKALSSRNTEFLLALMERSATGARRIKAGLPAEMRFAHKTGTQRGRTCDAGLIRAPYLGQERRVLVVACTQGQASLAEAEKALMQVGAAICSSGLLTHGVINAPICPSPPNPGRQPVVPER